MQRIRYVGDAPAVDLAIPGACLQFERGKWEDPAALCSEAHVPVSHLEIVLRGLGPDWEFEKPRKSTATTSPAKPDEEKS